MSSALDPTEIEALRSALGRPTSEQISIAVEEVERQVVLEDLLVMMVEAVRETVRAFFDFIAELDAGALDLTSETKEESHDE